MEEFIDGVLVILLIATVLFLVITWILGMEPQILGAMRQMGGSKPPVKMQQFTFRQYVQESVAHEKVGWFGTFMIILAFPGAKLGRHIHNAMI